MPTLYKENCYKRLSRNSVKIKIYHKNDWVWREIELREQDFKYIERHCASLKELVPNLKQSGKSWCLVFPFKEKVKLSDVLIKEKRVCSVDLVLNNNAVCSIMQSNGTVIAKKFINLAIEKDRLSKALGRQKKLNKMEAVKLLYSRIILKK